MKRIARHARVLSARTLSAVAFVTLTAAFLLLLARVIYQSVPLYREGVQEWLSEALGQSLLIGEIHTRWRGWNPLLEIRDVRLMGSDGRVEQHFEQMQVAADLVALVRDARLAVGSIRLSGARLNVVRQLDGHLKLVGLEDVGLSADPARATPRWLAAVEDIEFAESEILWRDLRHPRDEVHLTDLNLRLRSDGSQHRLRGTARIARANAGRLELAGRFDGPWESLEEWHGDLYLKATGLEPKGWPGRWLSIGLDLDADSAAMELWATVSERRISAVDGYVALTGIDVALAPGVVGAERASIEIDRVSATVRWEEADYGGWKMEVDELRLALPEVVWPRTRLVVQRHVDDGASARLRMALSYLGLGDAVTLAKRLSPHGEHWLDDLLAMEPSGELREVRLELGPARDDLRYDARVIGLRTIPWRTLPALENLDARIRGQGAVGLVELNARKSVVRAPELLEEPLELDELSGEIWWQRDDSGISLRTENLTAADAHMATQTRAALTFPAQSGAPFLDLQMAFQGPPMSRVTRYLPMKKYKPKLRRWLNRAFGIGRVTRGDLLYYGELRAFPFRESQGIFEARLETDGATLTFHEDWPDVTGLGATVVFRNTAMRILGREGTILGSHIRRVEAEMPNMARPHLAVTGALEGPASDSLRFLAESPLRKRFGKIVADLRLSGQSEMDLNLRIPIGDEHEARTRGQVSFRDAGLDVVRSPLRLSGLRGTLGFSDKGLDGKHLRAKLWDRDVVLDIVTEPSRESGESPLTRVQLRGVVDVEALAKQHPEYPWDLLAGEANWVFELNVPSRATSLEVPIGVRLESDLSGLEVRLPEPFGKDRESRAPLVVSARIHGDQLRDFKVHHASGITAGAAFSYVGGHLAAERIEVHLGTGRPPRHTSPGLHLTGRLPRVDAKAWIDHFGAGRGRGGLGIPLQSVDMSVDQLALLGQTLTDVRLRLQRSGDVLAGRLESREVRGALRLPPASDIDAPVDVSLDRLKLVLARDTTADALALDPRHTPLLRISAEQLWVGDADLGAMRLVTTRTRRGQRLQTLELKADDYQATVSGTWEVSGAAQRCEFSAQVTSDTLSGLVNRMGVPSNVQGGKTRIEADARWPGGIRDFSLQTVKGTLRLQIGKGRFLDLDPGVGRVFGLLNLETVLRRLTLDFSDLYSKGYAFDRIEGDFTIGEGDAYTDKLVMKSPSSTIKVSGRSGLVTRDYAQQVTVTPKFSTALPVAGAIAGGPIVGGFLLLAQQLVGKKLDRFSDLKYSVTGPWSDPVVERSSTIDRDSPDRIPVDRGSDVVTPFEPEVNDSR